MRIVSVEAWMTPLRIATPYAVAYGAFDTAENAFLRIHTNGPHTGLGCAAPDPHVTGESAGAVLGVMKDIITPSLVGADPLRAALLLHRLRGSLGAFPSAMAAVDIALHDLLGKVAGLPVYKILGGFRDRMKTCVTVGILPEDETVAASLAFVRKGFHALKLKGGRDPEQDAARVIKVREAVGPRIELRFDANQGYTFEQAVQFIEAVRPCRLSLVEQPTPQGRPDLLGRVTHEVSTPIMADESLVSLVDAFRLAKRSLVDMVNVKLMKVGGITEALAVNAVARAAGLEVMVGCMDEAEIGIAAGLHFALARPNVVFADLDGHLDLIDDPTRGAISLRDGVLYPSNRPGLGL